MGCIKATEPDKWLTTKEIKRDLKDRINPKYVRKALIKLWAFNIVEFKGKHTLDPEAKWRITD